MSRKISEDKLNLIRKRLMQGCSVREIADEVQVSKSTVQKYKKNTPAPFRKESDTGDNSITYDYTTLLTKKEEAFTKKIEKEIFLYDDEEEGWIYHLSKHDHRLKQSGLWWNAIVYPDSAPEGWIERLKAQGLRFAISPLHDKDTWSHNSKARTNPETGEIIEEGAIYKRGDRKKAHWHIIVISDIRVGYVEMNDLIRNITHGPYIQKCRSLSLSYSYFLHINAPEKYQGYEKSEIQEFNNFHLEPNKYEVNTLIDEILQTILEKGFTSHEELYRYYQGQIEYVTIINSKPHLASKLIQDNWRKRNPEGKVQKIELVNPREVHKQINEKKEV